MGAISAIVSDGLRVLNDLEYGMQFSSAYSGRMHIRSSSLRELTEGT